MITFRVVAEYAVHAAMAGYTNCGVGIVRSYSALIPFEAFCSAKKHLIKYNDRNWQRLIQSTGQPPFLNEKPQSS